MKMTTMTEGSQLKRLIHSFQSLHQVNHVTVPYSQISLFIENQVGGDRSFESYWKIWVHVCDFFIQFITSIQRYAYIHDSS